jgi:hypothetical protein
LSDLSDYNHSTYPQVDFERSIDMYTTDMYEGVHAETVTLTGANGDSINAYLARPHGSFPALVLAHHMPGWDAWYREITFKFALH